MKNSRYKIFGLWIVVIICLLFAASCGTPKGQRTTGTTSDSGHGGSSSPSFRSATPDNGKPTIPTQSKDSTQAINTDSLKKKGKK